MSEPKLISPMLDNFEMGDPISSHNGVRCCPAMKKDSDQKYIVKIISIPSSQIQLDALLLSGAYADKTSACVYFKDLADDVEEEAGILEKLSNLEGFIAYEACQVVPMDDASGFDVYLLGRYNRTLEQYLRRNAMTHLAAINLGLDLCASLSLSRHSGYLYVDLKPSNILITEDRSYRIGDLGFISLASLKYTSLPDKYRSQYTAPEIADAFSALNETIDIYAVGLILYQVYNDGLLPFKGDTSPAEAFPPPAYADYEMAEIILKACAPDPTDRWQDPIQMGQALVAYMQRNGANDTPIVPVSTPVGDQVAVTESATNAVVSEITDDPSLQYEDIAEETDENENKDNNEFVVDPDAVFEEANDEVDEATEAEESPVEIETLAVSEEISSDEANNGSEADADFALQENSETVYLEDDFGNLSFLSDAFYDETVPNDASAIEYHEVSDEVSKILSYADELIAHPAPDPVIPPEPIDVPIPEPLTIRDECEEIDESTESETSDVQSDNPVTTETILTEETDPYSLADVAATVQAAVDEANSDDDFVQPGKKSGVLKRWIIGLVILALIAGLGFAGVYFYQNYYLQPISISLNGNNGSLTVYVTAQIDEDKLTVVCSDTYGIPLTEKVVNGKAEFRNLTPGSGYTVKVLVDGFHRLTGNTSTAYSTPVQTNVVQFDAITGSEDGSVVLAFAIDGPDSQQWKVRYSADGEDERVTAFSGHMVTVTGLTVGKAYTFSLEPNNNIFIAGNSSITYTAKAIVRAEDLSIESCNNHQLVASWRTPDGADVKQWTVRCYNKSGFDKTITTEETTATFTELDHTDSYTIEVTAEGMSVNERAYVAENSITVSDFQVVTSDPNNLTVIWMSNQEVADDGWIILYTVDGSDTHEAVCTGYNTAQITPAVPDATYSITLLTADGNYVFDGTYTFDSAPSSEFEGYNVTAENIEFNMCRTPSVDNWDRYDLAPEDYTTSFVSGEKASFLLRMRREYNTSSDNIVALFVIRNSEEKIVSFATTEQSWTSMWYRNYCELDIPSIPDAPGSYRISVFFNGQLAGEREFTVTSS